MRYLLIIISIFMIGCTNTSLYIGAGIVEQPELEDQYDLQASPIVGIVRAQKKFPDKPHFLIPDMIEWEHQSSIPDGPPIDGEIDDRWQERFMFLYEIYSN